MDIINTPLYKAKIEAIDKYYSRFKLLDRECPYILGVRVYNNEPLITILGVECSQLMDGDTIIIKIPSIVEAIDQTRWLRIRPFDNLSKALFNNIKQIRLIGNNRPIHGRLCGAFQLWKFTRNSDLDIDNGYLSTKQLFEHINIDENSYIFLPQLERVRIEQFKGENIHDISYMAYQANMGVDINIEDIGINELQKADNIESRGNILGRLIEQGVKLVRIRSLEGFQQSIESWRNQRVIDLQNIDISLVCNFNRAFADCQNLEQIVGLDRQKMYKYVSCIETFAECRQLKEVPDIFKHVIIRAADRMFIKCDSLRELQGIDIRNQCSVNGMYSYCNGLQEIILDGTSFTDENNSIPCIKLSNMFAGCRNIRRIHIKNIELKNGADLSNIFWGLENLEYATFEDISVGLSLSSNECLVLTQMFEYSTKLSRVTFKNIQVQTSVCIDRMFAECKKLVEVNINGLSIYTLERMQRAFQNCKNLKRIKTDRLNIQEIRLNTFLQDDDSEYQTLENIFSGCSQHLFIGLLSRFLKYDVFMYKSILRILSDLQVNPPDSILLETANNFRKYGVSIVKDDQFTTADQIAIRARLKTAEINRQFNSRIYFKTPIGKFQTLKLIEMLNSNKQSH